MSGELIDDDLGVLTDTLIEKLQREVGMKLKGGSGRRRRQDLGSLDGCRTREPGRRCSSDLKSVALPRTATHGRRLRK